MKTSTQRARISAEELGTMFKNNLRGITLVGGSILGIHLDNHLPKPFQSCTYKIKGQFTLPSCITIKTAHIYMALARVFTIIAYMKGFLPFLRVLVRPRIKGKVAVANRQFLQLSVQ